MTTTSTQLVNFHRANSLDSLESLVEPQEISPAQRHCRVAAKATIYTALVLHAASLAVSMINDLENLPAEETHRQLASGNFSEVFNETSSSMTNATECRPGREFYHFQETQHHRYFVATVALASIFGLSTTALCALVNRIDGSNRIISAIGNTLFCCSCCSIITLVPTVVMFGVNIKSDGHCVKIPGA